MPPNPVPTISVVVPVYNGESYLRRGVESVLRQTSPAHEVLVVDDCSSDRTRESLGDLDPQVSWHVHGVNRGIPSGRNTGIRVATGDWIALLDSDDWWEADKLARQAALIQAAPHLDAVFCDFMHRWPDGSPAQWRGGMLGKLRSLDLELVPVGEVGYELVGPVAHRLIEQTSFIHPSTLLVRRGAFDRAGLFDEFLRNMEDLEMWIRLARVCRFGFVDAVLTQVEQRPTSLGHNIPRAAEHMLKVYGGLPGLFAPEVLPGPTLAAMRRHKAWAHRSLAWADDQRGERKTARHHYLRAMREGFEWGDLKGLARNYLPGGLIRRLRGG